LLAKRISVILVVFPLLFVVVSNAQEFIDNIVNEIVIKTFHFEGNYVFSSNELVECISKFQNKPLTKKDLEEIRNNIETKYREKGYILAEVKIPMQTIIDDTMLIKISEGIIGNVNITWKAYKLTEDSLDNLRGEDVPEKIVSKLAKIKNIVFTSLDNLTRKLQIMLDKNELNKYISKIHSSAAMFWTKYVVTDDALQRIFDEDVIPYKLFIEIRSLKNNVYIDDSKFQKDLIKKIGKKNTHKYLDVILRNSLNDNRYYDSKLLPNYLSNHKGKTAQESKLLKSLYLINDFQKSNTQMVLTPGKPGQVDIILRSEEKRALDIGIDYNNFGSDQISRNRYGISIKKTLSYSGIDFSLRGMTGDDIDDSSFGDVKMHIPVNAYGSKLNLNAMSSSYVVGKDFVDLGIEGSTEIYGLNFSHPFIKDRWADLTVSLRLERKYTKNKILSKLRNIDELVSCNLTVDYEKVVGKGKNFLSFGTYYGVIDDNNSSPPGRLDYSKEFVRFAIQFMRIHKLEFMNSTILFKADIQYSPNRLLSSEQYSIGGYGSVRGRKASLFLGDSGSNISAEFMFSPSFKKTTEEESKERTFWGQKISKLLQFAVFIERGDVIVSKPTEDEDRDDSLLAAGAGVRLMYKDKFNLRLDVGFPLTKRKSNDEDSVYAYLIANWNF